MRQNATRRAIATDRFRGGSMPVCPMDLLRPTVPRLFIRPAQALESPADRPRRHETKRRATARFGVARRRPTAARAACGVARLMLHLAAGWCVGQISGPKPNRLDMRRPRANSSGNRNQPPPNNARPCRL
jgi:hypothetical protein